jgi:hypothetical protein
MPVELFTMIGDNSPMLMLNRKVAKEAEDALSLSSRTKWYVTGGPRERCSLTQTAP